MTDVLVRAAETLVEGGRLVMEDIRSVDLASLWTRIKTGDIDITQMNLSTILATLTATVIVVLFAYANLMPDTDDDDNGALGLRSGVVHNKDAPPIPPPTEVVSLRVYPIKSCRGFEVDASRLRKSGLLLDRNWMFIDRAKKEFLTIRSDSKMTLIDTSIVEEGAGKNKTQLLRISINGTETKVHIPAFPSEQWLKEHTKLETVNIWGADTDGHIYGDDINNVFTEFFGKDVALVYKGPSDRMVAINGSKDLYGSETPHHFADVMSLLIASEASLKDLNRRLKRERDNTGYDAAPLTIERFRPNIIVRGRDQHAWEEDTWKRIRISTRLDDEKLLYRIDLDVVARCARCQVPNVDPDTADKHPKQPWDELMKFRRVDKGGVAKYKPCFGMLCIPKNEGVIKLGATLEVLETTDKHLYNEAKFEDL